MLLLVGSGTAALSSKPVKSRKAGTQLTGEVVTQAQLAVLEHSQEQLVLEWNCPEITLERDEVTREIVEIGLPGAIPVWEKGVPCLPRLSGLFEALPGGVRFSILEQEVETRTLGPMAAMPEDTVIDMRPEDDALDPPRRGLDEMMQGRSLRERCADMPRKPGLWPAQPVTLGEAGTYRGHRLMNLLFHPVQVDAERGIARITRRIRVRLTLPRSDGHWNRTPDSAQETNLLRNLLGDLAVTAQPTHMPEAFEGRRNTGRLDDDPIGGRYKLFVVHEGITRVSAEWLTQNFVDPSQITPFDLKVKMRGSEIPIHFDGGADGTFDSEDFFEFHSIPNRNTLTHLNPSLVTDPWSEANVYWMSWGDGVPGLRLGEEDGAWHPEWDPIPVNRVRSSFHFEKDTKFDRLAMAVSNPLHTSRVASEGPYPLYDDHYFWGNRIDALTTRDFQIQLPAPDVESLRPVLVRACLQGFSWGFDPANDRIPGEHRAIIYLNGATERGLTIGRVPGQSESSGWMDMAAVILQSDPEDPRDPGITGQELADGNNIISVSLPGDGVSGEADKVYANWFDVEYDRELLSSKGFLQMRFDTTRGDTFSFDIRGFSSQNIQVWKLGQSRLTNPDIRFATKADEGASFWVRFPLVADGAYEILAFDERHIAPPLSIEPEQSTRDLRTMAGSEYLLISHERFRNEPSLLRLDSLRRASFNGSADTIWVSQIYEQFNWGIPSPEAIREFLRYAYENWPTRPTHACLVGDGVYSIRGYTGNGNLIPPFYPPVVVVGVVAADILFGCVSGPPWDITPDIAVGRISARTPEELETYVSKVWQYEVVSDYSSAFHSTLLFVADLNDGQYNFSKTYSEYIIRLTDDNVNIERVYLDSLPAGQGPAALRRAFRRGATVVNYNGHGGGGVWSGTELLDVGGVRLLTNRRAFPFVTNFTCYVGSFDDQNQAAVLGEAFLFSRSNTGDLVGAIGVYSSSGVGWAGDGRTLQRTLYDFISENRGLTIGQIVQINKTRHWANHTALQPRLQLSVQYSSLMMMNLLGDPGLKLALPADTFSPTIADDDFIMIRGDSFQVAGTLPWDPGTGLVDLYVWPFNGERFLYEPDTVNGGYIPEFFSAKIPAFDANTDLWTEQIVQGRSWITPPLPFPSKFVLPEGRVVVYAVDQDQKRSAIGSFPIFYPRGDTLGVGQVFNVEILPYGYIYTDSIFQIRANIIDSSGVERVQLRAIYRPPQGPVVIDTMEMTQLEPGLWITPELGPLQAYGATYRVSFNFLPIGGEFRRSSEFSMRMEQLPDFYVNSAPPVVPKLEPRHVPSVFVPAVYTRQAGAREAESMTIRLSAVRDSLVFVQGDTVRFVLDTFATVMTIPDPIQYQTMFDVHIPAIFRQGVYRVYLDMDPNQLIRETTELNNRYIMDSVRPFIFPATNTAGTYLLRPYEPGTFHRYKSPAFPDTIRLRASPGSFPRDSVSLIYNGPRLATAAEIADLAQLGLFPILNTQTPRIFEVTLDDTTDALPFGAEIALDLSVYGSADSLRLVRNDLALFHRRLSAAMWRRLDDSHLDTLRTIPDFRGRMRGTADGLGEFVVLRMNDEQGPYVEFAANGLRFTSNSFLPREPELFVTMRDFSGIDRGPGKFYVIVDGDTVPDAELSWSDSLSSSGQMSALLRPEFAPGLHTISAYATDNMGNSTTASAQFEVRGEFGMEWAINYPNPFSTGTTISYLLTDLTSDYVEVKIYTVSGRLIKRLREDERIVSNYGSIFWDGTDEHFETVANGVYFARVIAKQGDEEIEKRVKMAKVR